ncbi:MAG: methylenetetrahydrofolate reductase C-terminal domain-containing protein [Oscillospiraceae bacterium]|nr:methylenetetrahydrofolate reductase C-terminal domain-containing protein [Oscillospiraceae bacterium]
MLMTKIKSRDQLLKLAQGKVFLVTCFGCKELSFQESEDEAAAIIHDVMAACHITGYLSANYICNDEYLQARFAAHSEAIAQADTILVFSCGVGVQTVAAAYPEKRVCAACDTYPLPGFQGVTPLEHDCGQCGQCYLNLTGGICPITACSKSLLNGQCGGAKNGMCEVDPNMECGWERIQRRLAQVGRLDALKCPIQLRDYATDDE